MKFTNLVTAAAVAVSFSVGGAVAGTVDFDDYIIGDAQTDLDGSGSHGLYLVGFLPDSGYDAKRWSISNGEATVAESGLSFSADVTSSINPSYGFKLTAALDPVATPASGTPGPECQGGGCEHISDDDIRYYNKDGVFATLVGTGSIAGLMIDLFVNDVNGEKPAQLGEGGSWFSANTDLTGFATWLTWVMTDDGGYDGFGSEGAGDINWLLGDSSTVSEVPLPAAGWLMIAGLGGLAAMRRRANA